MSKDTDFAFGANTKNDPNPPAWSECMARVECRKCGKFHGYCSEIGAEAGKQGAEQGAHMKVGAYIKDGMGDRLPFIQAKNVGKAAKVKIVSVRAVSTPKFNGLFLDVKLKDKKYSLPARFDRPIDLGNIVRQMGSDDTDDWPGQFLKLVTARGKKGGMFVNVVRK